MPQTYMYVIKSTSKILTKYTFVTRLMVFFNQQVYFTYLSFSVEIKVVGIHRQFFENECISIAKAMEIESYI